MRHMRETDRMKYIVHKIVPTYHLREADIEQGPADTGRAMDIKIFQTPVHKLPSAFLSDMGAEVVGMEADIA